MFLSDAILPEKLTLEDTVPLMLSDDYRKRMKAEYMQTLIRANRLYHAIMNGTLKNRERDLTLAWNQYTAMSSYLDCLQRRMMKEKFLNEVMEEIKQC